jgi:glycine/D-amino acid oxidase-like deaminating enzyme
MIIRPHSSHRILIVGGGVSGLSIATRLAQAGLPVTVLEASQLGFGASTRNQGWLSSGAWFAPESPDLARLCYESLHHTLRFCPECVEPDSGTMVYLVSHASTTATQWTAAWEAAGIPYTSLTSATVFERFPGLSLAQTQQAFELPDRSIKPQILLQRLAEAAQRAGAEIRESTPVMRLVQCGNSVEGVLTTQGEIIPARLVILAGNARGGSLFPGFGAEAVGTQSEVALVVLKTHLAAVRPTVSRWPLCVVDAEGFNHLPHQATSVFGSNRWLPARHGEDEQMIAGEVEKLWEYVTRFFPDVRRDAQMVKEWSGTTVHAMHVEQVAPGRAPLPTVVDHAQGRPLIANLLSVFPGRASLWPQLAEQTQRIVLERIEQRKVRITPPPWSL